MVILIAGGDGFIGHDDADAVLGGFIGQGDSNLCLC